VCIRLVSFTLICLISISSFAQQSPASDNCGLRAPERCAFAIAKDQTAILTSPFHIRKKDLVWLLPFVAATGTALAFDRKTLEQVSTTPSQVENFRRASNLTGIYAPLAGMGATWLTGVIRHDDHLRETGFLAGEAIADTILFTSILKYGTDRVRPKAAGLSAESGEFWPDGKHYAGADSFPSGHSAMAFAFAHVVASEYPNWKTKLLVYSLAAATAVERVGGREHFPSDVLVGSAIGYLVGGYVYNHQAASSRTHILLSPIVGNKAVGVSLAFSF